MVEKLFIYLVGLYRKYLSPLKGRPCCRFYPSCSQYAIDAFSEWGALRGLGLSVWRILRCNPFCRGGFDLVRKNPKRHREARCFRAIRLPSGFRAGGYLLALYSAAPHTPENTDKEKETTT